MTVRALPLALALLLALPGCLDGGRTTLLQEDFERAEARLPDTVQAVVGDWRVEAAPAAPSGDRVLLQSSTSNANAFAVATAQVPASFVARVNVQVLSGTDEREAGIVARYGGPGDSYIFRLDAKEGGVRFTRVHEGLQDDLHKDRQTRFYPNQWYALELRVQGDEFTGFVDGRQVFQVRDGTHDGGRVGLWTRQDTTARFDDFAVVA